jgi:integrase
MKNQYPSYLYRFQNSKNYYFRIRQSFSDQMYYDDLDRKHFVASLRTAKLDEALWLAQFIKRKLKDEIMKMNFFVCGDTEQLYPTLLPAELDASNIIAQREFEQFLRGKFKKLLKIGKYLLKCQIIPSDQLLAIRAPSESQISLYKKEVDLSESIHPTFNNDVIELKAKELKNESSQDFQKYARIRDASMLTQLMKSLKSLAVKANAFDIDIDDDVEKVSDSSIMSFINVLGKCNEFSNYMRKNNNETKVVKAPLKKTFEKFIAHKDREVQSDSVSQYTASFKFLFSLIGENYDVNDINRKVAASIKEAVLELPANKSKGCDGKKLAAKTVNRYLKNYGHFLKWFHDHNQEDDSSSLYEFRSPFKSLLLNENTGKTPKRRRFTEDELNLMKSYAPKSKREAKDCRESSKWFPLIGMYSGQRLNEIAGIKLKDIGCRGGIHYFDLTERHIKNKSSERLAPIHSKLIAFGLLDFVKKCRERGDTYLFQDLHNTKKVGGRDGFGEAISKWFNRSLLKNIGIDKKQELENYYKVDFHCLRKTVLNCFKHHGVSDYVVRQLVGHDKNDDITFDVGYGEDAVTQLSVLQRVIEHIDY